LNFSRIIEKPCIEPKHDHLLPTRPGKVVAKVEDWELSMPLSLLPMS
jgi:hypothetical protein